MLRALAAAAVLALLIPACRRAPGPEETYRAFVRAARAGDAATVWSLLAERSRAELDTRARALAADAPAAVRRATGQDLVLGDLAPSAPPIEKTIVLRESRDAAVVAVTVTGGGAPQEISLVREGGAWRVVLPPLSSPAP
jgi:hypothetical protein